MQPNVSLGQGENQGMTNHHNGRVLVIVSYGYDIHSVEMPASTWLNVQSGEALAVQGQGFSADGEFSQHEWAFNVRGRGSLQVTAEGARDIFDGMLNESPRIY